MRLSHLALLLCGCLATPSLGGNPFTFSLSKHACGVCQEVLSGLPCELFSACHAVNASSSAGGCASFCGGAFGGSRAVSAERSPAPAAAEPDVRVVRGFGTKGYDQIRISVVSSSGTPPAAGFFDYSAQFRYRWTDNFLHSAMKTVAPGKTAAFPLGSGGLSVHLPKQGAGVAGMLIADPCMVAGSITSWVSCHFGRKFDTYNRTVGLINTFVPDRSTDYWGILGDNFYDRTGDITKDVFGRISLAAKSKFFVTAPGNHDYWVLGNPWTSTIKDQCGNGFMQFYAQDAKSAEAVGAGSAGAPFNFTVDAKSAEAVGAGSAGAPFNFTVDPGAGHHLGYRCNVPEISNMFWYNQIGNVGLVGQSGAHSYEEAQPFMAEACRWLAAQPGLQVALLLGHWDINEMGASHDMDMPQWYKDMAQLPGCAEFNKRGMLKYVMGHTHCNEPHPRGDVGVGFRVGAFGMDGCGSYGVPILDTTESRVRFWYFDTSSDDLYGNVTSCVGQKGWRQCLHLATSWLDQPLPQTSYEEVVI